MNLTLPELAQLQLTQLPCNPDVDAKAKQMLDRLHVFAEQYGLKVRAFAHDDLHVEIPEDRPELVELLRALLAHP